VLASDPHRTTRQSAVNRSAEPAFCVSRVASAYVPIGRASRHILADVLCARSVHRDRAQIGRSVCVKCRSGAPFARGREVTYRHFRSGDPNRQSVWLTADTLARQPTMVPMTVTASLRVPAAILGFVVNDDDDDDDEILLLSHAARKGGWEVSTERCLREKAPCRPAARGV
jgi:hypothetical protein